ncbi:hypothetical protein [Streptomyces sp. NBC_01294]|uniref:hypothetical protein n=1 Tax=Streptomyces sp. NBC_01294 TaxID=2903815 RepID=UPI002DDB9413|nr:hypothetical protein [Streptomyces sp. NBC_01294]WRZ55912.1 hypothetical protein OG534_05130 [Streptomyces sp. NBC_01294]
MVALLVRDIGEDETALSLAGFFGSAVVAVTGLERKVKPVSMRVEAAATLTPLRYSVDVAEV